MLTDKMMKNTTILTPLQNKSKKRKHESIELESTWKRNTDCKIHSPGQMAEVAVSRACNEFTANGTKLLRAVTERNQLRRTDECEVQWVEEQHNIFAVVITQRDLLEFTVHNGHPFKGRSWFGWL